MVQVNNLRRGIADRGSILEAIGSASGQKTTVLPPDGARLKYLTKTVGNTAGHKQARELGTVFRY